MKGTHSTALHYCRACAWGGARHVCARHHTFTRASSTTLCHCMPAGQLHKGGVPWCCRRQLLPPSISTQSRKTELCSSAAGSAVTLYSTTGHPTRGRVNWHTRRCITVALPLVKHRRLLPLHAQADVHKAWRGCSPSNSCTLAPHVLCQSAGSNETAEKRRSRRACVCL